jgi:hypothetical protein
VKKLVRNRFNAISTLFAFIYLFMSFSGYAQNHANNWVIGYGIMPPPSLIGRVILDFTNDTFSINRTQGGHKFMMGFENTSYSDELRNLQFYFDGFNLGNKLHQIVEDGDTINPGEYWDDYQGAIYPISNASCFLTFEDKQEFVYLIHKRKVWDSNLNRSYSDKLYYTLISANENGGLGKVIFKNKIILEGDLIPSQMAICRHANGKFWWIINHDYWNSVYYKVLLTDTGFVKFVPQEIGQSTVDFTDNGNLLISFDGTKLIRTSITDQLQFMDFDRCSGELTNFKQVSVPHFDSARTINSCLSPNGRFLYVLLNTKIYQFDMQSGDIANSFIQIAEWDGFLYKNFFSTAYYDIQNAPDNKIYVSCISGNVYLHAINNPNEHGLSCNFVHRAVELPVYNASGLPNFANYSLGPKTGTDCDSLTATYYGNSNQYFSIYPNPTNGKIQVENKFSIPFGYFEIEIINITGQLIFKQTLSEFQASSSFNLSFLDSGIYMIQFKTHQKLLQISKLLIY